LPDEVIIVIDGSTDNTVQKLKSLPILLKDWKYIEQENKGRAGVRNRGATEAKSELLLFFDDDMRPESPCIETHINHHHAINQSILTGAQIDLEGKKDIQRYKAMLSRRWAEPLRQKEKTPLKREEVFITAANFSIPRALFLSLGGFDESLTDAEDFDLAVRAAEKGIPVYYDHRAMALHDDPVSGLSYIKRQRQYREAHKKLFAQYKERFSAYTNQEPVQPRGFKKMFFRFFCKRSWVNGLDRPGWMRVLPKKIRYKIYDWIITANGVYFPEKIRL
jgi:GT2 family glycosyltransferase